GRRVSLRQVEREGTPLAGAAHQPDLAAEQARQLAADGQAEAGAAVLAARAAVGLLERLEDDLLLVRRDADARIRYGEGEDNRSPVQLLITHAPAPFCGLDAESNLSGMRELERVGQQVLN